MKQVCPLLVLLVLCAVKVVQGSQGRLLHLGQVDQGCGPVVLQLGGSIGLQGAGLGAWGGGRGGTHDAHTLIGGLNIRPV